jgi:hypothetical protein
MQCNATPARDQGRGQGQDKVKVKVEVKVEVEVKVKVKVKVSINTYVPIYDQMNGLGLGEWFGLNKKSCCSCSCYCCSAVKERQGGNMGCETRYLVLKERKGREGKGRERRTDGMDRYMN